MKKVFYLLCIALAFATVSCKKDPAPADVEDITEDGFYVVGAATGQATVTKILSMANGHNEAAQNALRAGMYEKYIVLEANKEFSLAFVQGGKQTAYGATLTEFTPESTTGIYDGNPETPVLKGALVIGDSAPKMKVTKAGLYHIVLDLNQANDLTKAQILVSPVTWGVRGGMNSWGFDAMEATPSNDGSIKYSIKGAKLAAGGEFKFSYNSAWKITLDEKGEVKANTNLGKDCVPGGDNIKVEGAGKYDITLTFKLAGGDIANSYSYTVELKEASSLPTTMYMIGQDFGNWDWNSKDIVSLTPVNGKEGQFWCIRYFQKYTEEVGDDGPYKTHGFKFCAEKAWNGDFGGLTTNGGDDALFDGNCFVKESGVYMVYVDVDNSKVQVEKAKVYGIGPAYAPTDDGRWSEGVADRLFEEVDGKLVGVAQYDGDLRMYAASSIATSDWWTREFNVFDGTIEYRGNGGDQAAVPVKAGDVITLDFNAGTGEIGEGSEPIITIDGDLSDWDDIEGVIEGNHGFKFTYDDKYAYFLSARAKDENFDSLWGSSEGYVYVAFDMDKDPATGDDTLWGNGPFEYVGVIWPYGGTAAAPEINKTPESASHSNGSAIPSIKCDGVVLDNGVAIEFCIALKDLPALPADPTAAPFIVYSWGSPKLSKVAYHVGEDQPSIIAIDGDMSDWAEIKGVVNEDADPAYAEIKVVSDAKNVYFYARRTAKQFNDLWNGKAYIYFAFDTDNDATTGDSTLWGNGPYEGIFVIWPFAGTADAPAFAAQPLGDSTILPATGTFANYVADGDYDSETGVELEFSIPRADLGFVLPATEITIYSWGNKGGENMKNCPLKVVL